MCDTVCFAKLWREVDAPTVTADSAVGTGSFEVEPFRPARSLRSVERAPTGLAFQAREVIVLREKAKRSFYAWLSPQELEHLGGAHGEGELLAWLGALRKVTIESSNI